MNIEDGDIRLWDVLFYKAFELRDLYEIEVTNVTNGVRVEQSAVKAADGDQTYACAKSIIQAQAGVVSQFVGEMSVNHHVPAIICAAPSIGYIFSWSERPPD
mmetsp:Transcript_15994/g.33808  ORF Transcript_15994/g.33808 Transcript_15994/m.33808 type:complete len:102 (+) Transcript_15994:1450-1755(+)